MNQFGQMGMQSMGQGSTPPLPLNSPGNQVGSCCHITDCFRFYNVNDIMIYNRFSFIYFFHLNSKTYIVQIEKMHSHMQLAKTCKSHVLDINQYAVKSLRERVAEGPRTEPNHATQMYLHKSP